VAVTFTTNTAMPQVRKIISNTGTQLTVDAAWVTQPAIGDSLEIFDVKKHSSMQPSTFVNAIIKL
jgi:hypothetical protein